MTSIPATRSLSFYGDTSGGGDLDLAVGISSPGSPNMTRSGTTEFRPKSDGSTKPPTHRSTSPAISERGPCPDAGVVSVGRRDDPAGPYDKEPEHDDHLPRSRGSRRTRRADT